MTAATFIAMAATFNLICSGESVTTRGTGSSAETEFSEFETTYRVDLTERRWCRDKCERTFAFAAITPTELIFDDMDIPSEKAYNHVTVNRESGSYSVVAGWIFGTVMKTGYCTKAPFEGFPSRKF